MQQASSSKILFSTLFAAALLCAPAVPTRAAEKVPQSKASAAAPVDINTASLDDLIRIPSIGKVTAEKIVAFREANGPFRRIEDLIKVPGIGEKSFEKLRPYITVSQKH